jgi:hypothetical protein
VLQQWEIDAQKSEDQEEKLNVSAFLYTDNATFSGLRYSIQLKCNMIFSSVELVSPATKTVPAG